MIRLSYSLKLGEYEQEIPQSHTAAHPWHREEEPQNIYSNKTPVGHLKQSHQLTLSLQDDLKTEKDSK